MASPVSTPFRVAVVGSHDASVLAEVVAGFPERSGHAVLIPSPDGDQLIQALRTAARLPVTEVRQRVRLEPDRVFVIPWELDGWVVGDEIHVEPGILPRAPLDRLMRTAADQMGRSTAGIVLGGPGSDGLIGIKRIKEAGGITIAQSTDRPVSPAHLMAVAGLADLVLPPSQIGARLVELAHAEEQRTPTTLDDSPDAATVDRGGENLRDILTFVRVRSGHDFGAYKRATLFRRVARRMQVCQCTTMAAYLQYLREDPTELAHLLRDFLISVTNFFRDPEAFEALQRDVIPKLFANKTSKDQLRVWIAGCATGEEPYTLAILLCEHARTLDSPPSIQVFATDIDEHALAIARAGRYPDTIALDVSAERLSQFFTAEAGVYQVSKELREMVLFSPHNVLRDPPFSRLDLVSCRNLMIYLNRDAQDRVLNVFHFALNAEGFLLLGASESAESSPLFSAVDAKQRVFVRRPTPGLLSADALGTATRWRPPPAGLPAISERPSTTSGELHHRLVEQYAPPSILVNEELDVLHVSENAGQFLHVAGGEPTRQLLRLVHPDLRVELRTAIHTARQSGHGFDTRVVRIDDHGMQRAVEIRVRSLDLPELGRGALLVMFDELAVPADGAALPERSTLEPVVREIEEELRRTKEQLRSTVEQYETSLEELKASNEELQAINEELRSATEELETSKEELQSVNEELTTLNHELKIKVDEVTRTNSDLQNLMTSTDIAVVFLDRLVHIKRFTPRAQELFNVIPTDIGRPLAHVTHKLENLNLTELATTVIVTLRTVEREVRSFEGKRYLLRMLPYRSLEDRIEGVVFTLVEVTDLRDALEGRRQSEAALATSQVRLRTALHDAPMVVLVLGSEERVVWGYAFGAEVEPGAEALLKTFSPGHADRFAAITRETAQTQTRRRAELQLLVDGEVRTYDFRFEPQGTDVSAVGFDITPSKVAEASLRDADRRKDEFLATLSHELRNPLTPLKVALDVARLTTDPDQLRETRGIMERQVAQLGKLIDDLLDLSRITQGRITLERRAVPCAELFERALEAMRPQLAQRRQELHVEIPQTSVHVMGDRSRLIQVLTNLLSNAVKFTPEGGRIDLIGQVDLGLGVLRIRVRDTGIGIAKEMLARIFEIFVQCRDENSRAQGGLGIGLNVVRRLVELQGGTVAAHSDGEGKGSEFVVELPLVGAT